jgi:hypothetical protein
METFRDYLMNAKHDYYYDNPDRFPEWVINVAEAVQDLHDNDYHCDLPTNPIFILKYIQKMNLKDLPPNEAALKFLADLCEHNHNSKQDLLGF